MNNNPTLGVNQTLTGYYKVGVVSPDGEVSWKAEGKNLILNQGMDNIANNAIADQMTYAMCGTGTRPNSRDGGTSAISQSGATIFLNDTSGFIKDFSSSFDAYSHLCSVGDSIQWANGSQSLILATGSNGFTLTVTPVVSYASASTFIVWKTSQVGLQTEISRSGPGISQTSYLTGTGNCGSTFNNIGSGSIIHRRTYDFPLQAGQQSFNEIGVGWANTAPTTVFSRVLITPVTVWSGFRLRIVYDLQVQYSPIISSSAVASIGGWPVSPATTLMGTSSLQYFMPSYIDTSGNTIKDNAPYDPYFINESYYYWFSMFVSTNSASVQPFGFATDRSSNSTVVESVGSQASLAAYAPLSFYCDKTANITAGSLSSNSIRTVGFGVYGNGRHSYGGQQAYVWRFNQAQTLFNTQTLSLTFRYTWTRTLG